jgi:hypothetical protein
VGGLTGLGPGLAAEAKNNQPLIRRIQLTFGPGVHVTMWRIVYSQWCTVDEKLFWPYMNVPVAVQHLIVTYVVVNKR